MKVFKLIITILFVLTLKTYAQDSLVVDGKIINSTHKLDDNKIIELSKTKKMSREFDFSFSPTNGQTENLNKNLQLNHLAKDNNFIDSPWFKVVVGTAISFGASAAYFKNKANDSDELYKRNGNSKDLNNRNKYDTYGGIALGALELNVGFLIYKFLTD
ncbi:MAG: hypothetical protein GY936_03275 [Ignavibacteriae bacterium]|nr:hypothetical protein [Ignavibacteriota bacterium]